MKEIRKKRLEESVKRELSELIIRTRVKDDRIGFVSITGASLDPDFSNLTVFVSLFGDEDSNHDTWQALRHHAGRLQSDLSRNLHFRQTPKLVFQTDDSIRQGDEMIDKLEAGQTQTDEN